MSDSKELFRVADIFESIQGEGMNSGRSAMFVRLAGCNAACDFCDTDHKMKELLSAEEIVRQCSISKTDLTVLTGGEPMLQVTKELVEQLLELGDVAIETNGSIPIPDPIRDILSWITVSPKDVRFGGKPCVLDFADELKVVWDGRVDPLKLAGDGSWSFRIIQPEWSRWNQHLPNILAFLRSNPGWRLGLQIHKIINIP
jgi:organic radical activating enzyme